MIPVKYRWSKGNALSHDSRMGGFSVKPNLNELPKVSLVRDGCADLQGSKKVDAERVREASVKVGASVHLCYINIYIYSII